MKTIEITLYKFNELSEKSQQNAIENNYNINVDHDWWALTYDEAETVGLKINGFGLDRNKHCNLEFYYSAFEVAELIKEDHGENCNTYKKAVSFLNNWSKLVEKYSNGIETDIVSVLKEADFDEEADNLEEKFKNSLREDYAQILQDELEYLMSEEAIKEALIANDYDFTEDGKIY